MLAVIAVLLLVRFVILPQGRLCNGDATFLHRYDSRVRGSPAASPNYSKTDWRLTRLANYEAVSFEGDDEAKQQPRKRLPPDTLLALDDIIAMVPVARGWYLGHFLGPMCLFRQPPPNPVFRPRNRLQ